MRLLPSFSCLFMPLGKQAEKGCYTVDKSDWSWSSWNNGAERWTQSGKGGFQAHTDRIIKGSDTLSMMLVTPASNPSSWILNQRKTESEWQ